MLKSVSLCVTTFDAYLKTNRHFGIFETVNVQMTKFERAGIIINPKCETF